MAAEDRLVVVDGTNLFWRSYHGLINQAFEHDGRPTFAVYGTINTLSSTFRSHKPTHAVVIFDWGKSAYRLEIWPKYKAGRPTSEVVDREDSDNQMSVLQDLLPKFGVSLWRERDVEADDVIARVVQKFQHYVGETIVVTGDKDMRQLAGDDVTIVHPSIGYKKETRWDGNAVLEHYGVEASRLPEIWALSGDKVDNIPGVPGIGEKTAIKLIQKYGDISRVALSDEKKIEGYRHDINMSLKLVQLNPSLSMLEMDLNSIKFDPVGPHDVHAKELRETLNSMAFDSLSSRWINGSLWSERGVRLRDLKQDRI